MTIRECVADYVSHMYCTVNPLGTLGLKEYGAEGEEKQTYYFTPKFIQLPIDLIRRK